jgi:hypothetical protein
MLDGEIPQAALWPLMHTWTLSAAVLGNDNLTFWQKAAGELGLLGAGFAERVEGLDHFIDEIEVTLDAIASANGLDALAGT